jgi:transposase-like protein
MKKNSNDGGSSRNGHTEKTVLPENQETAIKAPRDRNGTFEPSIVPKRRYSTIKLFQCMHEG